MQIYYFRPLTRNAQLLIHLKTDSRLINNIMLITRNNHSIFITSLLKISNVCHYTFVSGYLIYFVGKSNFFMSKLKACTHTF